MPETLIDQAAARGDTVLAVTDRDGLYGAVKHARACVAAGIRPGLGAELSVHDDEHRPLVRVVVLAAGNTDGRGYAALCRAVSAAHEVGKKPSINRRRLAELDWPQSNGQAWLKPAGLMRQVARKIIDAGVHEDGALERLFRHPEELADRCALGPVAELGGGPGHGIDTRYASTNAVDAAHDRWPFVSCSA